MTPNLTGQTFSRLTILKRAPTIGSHAAWICRCHCGTLTTHLAIHLRSGHTRSCGCLKRTATIAASLANHARGHGLTPEYQAWKSMIKRCTNPRYAKYHLWGGRGITICSQWRHNFAAFLADMGPKPSPQHSLDRINNNGHYTPTNCRWATALEQRHNRRPSHRPLTQLPLPGFAD